MRTHVKDRPDAPEGFFEAEAAGLAWLAAASEQGGATIARVADVAPGRIELERIDESGATRDAAERFGTQLARTHAAGALAFGSPPAGHDGPNFIGRRAQDCLPTESWGLFYAEQRVRPFARAALEAGNLTADELRVVDRAVDLVASGALDDGRAPARLHGDLWAGNVLWAASGAVLIDPAAHGGHPETDLAMLALFGLPHLETVLAAYDDTAPLADGWRQRIPMHQLHPLAVHAAGHGRSYVVALADAAQQTLALA